MSSFDSLFSPSRDEPSHRRKPKVLLCESESLTRKLTAKVLTESGYDTIDIRSDSQVLECLSNSQFDVLVIGLSGQNEKLYQLCSAIRERYNEWQLPVIVLVEENHLDEIEHCITAGANDVVLKPTKWPLLLSSMQLAFKMSAYSKELKTKELHLKKAQSLARIGYWYMKNDPTNVTFSEQFCNIIDIPADSITTFHDLFSIVHPEDQERFMSEIQLAFIRQQSFTFSHRIILENRQEFFVSQIGEFSSISGKKDKEFFVTMQDETEAQFNKDRLFKEKYFDTTTGFANRSYFNELAQAIVTESEKEEKMLACFCIGVDGFKGINDALGHNVGDGVLKKIGERISKLGDEFSIIARYGSDVFTILSDSFLTIPEAELFASRILDKISEPLTIMDHDLSIKASVGISFYPFDGENVDELASSADLAMHSVKTNGGNGYSIHTRKMFETAKKQFYLESELKAAIEHGDLELHYQPQICIARNAVSGMEALVRWIHPERGLIPPLDFIELAEEKGLIIPMGEWILNQACSDAKEFHDLGYPGLRVGINLSAKQFNDPKFFQKIRDAISKSGIDPTSLELEVTESSAMSDLDNAIRVLRALQEMGAHTSMDDFGTGFSSLSNLQSLPLNTLKIDRAFVKDIGLRENAGAIAAAIITMAKGLGMETIAEGVETEGQLEFMRRQECDVIQGFYYSKPLRKADFIHYLKGYAEQENGSV